jgi:hypothetical protein
MVGSHQELHGASPQDDPHSGTVRIDCIPGPSAHERWFPHVAASGYRPSGDVPERLVPPRLSAATYTRSPRLGSSFSYGRRGHHSGLAGLDTDSRRGKKRLLSRGNQLCIVTPGGRLAGFPLECGSVQTVAISWANGTPDVRLY